MKEITGNDKIFFGVRKSDNIKIYMSKPSFDCNLYWSFGYLGNKNEHYHLSDYNNKTHFLTLKDGSHKLITEARNMNMHDCLMEDYELNPTIKTNLWSFCEQAATIYALKEIAEIFRGGSHFAAHPLKASIQGFDEGKIVNELLPQLLQKFWDDFSIELTP